MVDDWTIHSLKEHLDGRIKDLDDKYKERFEAQNKAQDVALATVIRASNLKEKESSNMLLYLFSGVSIVISLVALFYKAK